MFVDKINLIKEILRESSKAVLITRPCRFGKTLNMSMLQYFFAQEVHGRSTQGLFSGLKIAQDPEAFYHGLLLGLVAYLHQRGYVTKSNREGGEGRYDIAVIPQDATKLGIVLELKQISFTNLLTPLELEEKLSSLALEALYRMELKRYETELRQAGILRVCQIGLAFCGKQFQLQHLIRAYPENVNY